MQNLEVKTRSKRGTIKYIVNQQAVTTFLRHSEDRITVISGETVNIEIYNNGKCIFCGDKQELFEILTNTKTI